MIRLVITSVLFFVSQAALSQSIGELPKLSGHYVAFTPAPGYAPVEPTMTLVVRHRSCGKANLKLQSQASRSVTYLKVVFADPTQVDCPGPVNLHIHKLNLPVGRYGQNVVVLNPLDIFINKK